MVTKTKELTPKERITQLKKKGKLLQSSKGFVDILELHEDYFIAGVLGSGKTQKVRYEEIKDQV